MGSIYRPPMQTYSRSRAVSVFLMTVQALREVSIWPGQQPMRYCSRFEGGISLLSSCSSITLLDQQSLSQAWIECGNNLIKIIGPPSHCLYDKAFLVIGMQFSIGKMIKGRHNTITLCPIDRTDYHFRNRWA